MTINMASDNNQPGLVANCTGSECPGAAAGGCSGAGDVLQQREVVQRQKQPPHWVGRKIYRKTQLLSNHQF